ncbi:flavoprotein [Virgibacillus necropolis]|uniref:flavoprotein n=1 Tax=Virgibacillus necropolis TaxID=163877 RepID=UPI00384CE58D
MTNFNDSYESFKKAWGNFSIGDMKGFISKDYAAREVRDGEIVDFGYEESVEGWTQAFDYFSDKVAEWHLNDIGFIPVKDDEMVAILSATLTVDGKTMETANLFFDTFKKTSEDGWLMMRSYIETGVPLDKLDDVRV